MFFYIIIILVVEIGVGIKISSNVISANFITKAKSVFAQAFTSNFAVATA